MAKKWSDVVQSSQFQALGSDERELARQQYFDQVVAPQVGADDLDVARQQFDATTDINTNVSVPSAETKYDMARPPEAVMPAAEPSFMDKLNTAFRNMRDDYKNNLGNSLNSRTKNINEATGAFNAGQVSFPEAATRVGANLFALPADVGGAIVSAVTPNSVKEVVSDGIASAADTDLGRGTIAKINDINSQVGAWAADNPRTAFNLETLGTAGNGALGFIGTKGAGTGLNAGGKAVIEVPQAIGRKTIGIADKLNTKEIIPTAGKLKGLANESYLKAESVGGVLKPEITNRFVDEVQSMRPQTAIGKAIGGDSAFTKMADKIESIRNQPMSLQAAQEADELLGDAIDGEFINGRLSKEGKRLLDIQSSLRNQIEQADPMQVVGGKEGFAALQDGRKFYSASMKMGDVERIIRRAENSQVPATAIKTGFRNLAEQARKRGYSTDEIKAIDRAAKTGIATDALNVLGSRLGPIISGGTGFATAGPLGAAVAFGANQAVSGAARAGASALQKGRATDVTRAIAERAGVTGSAPRSELLDKAFRALQARNP